MRGLLLLVGLSFATTAFGWGDQGHRIIGYVATSQLSDVARTRLVALLGHDDLAQVSTWMDDERDRLAEELPGSPRWHYENRRTCNSTNPRACEAGNCVTMQIEHYRSVLSNPKLSRDRRAEAVRVLAHLVGDLHQPLHLADNRDRGGNDTFVIVPGERDPRRLHEVWDTTLVRMNLARRSPATYARSLISQDNRQQQASAPAERKSADTISIETWAAESFRIGTQLAYGALPGFSCKSNPPNPIVLDGEYITRSRAAVADQLRLAGTHLASVLNAALESN